MAAKKILMLVGDYAEDYETMVPFQALQMVGHQVHAVCPDKRAGQSVRTAIHDFEGDQTYSEKPGHNFTPQCRLCPGPRRGLRCPADPRRPRARIPAPERAGAGSWCVTSMPRASRSPRSAMAPSCWPPPAFCKGGRQRLSGRAPEVRLAGGEHVDLPPDQAHVDGHLVTAPAWPAHPAWLARFLEALGTRISH